MQPKMGGKETHIYERLCQKNTQVYTYTVQSVRLTLVQICLLCEENELLL